MPPTAARSGPVEQLEQPRPQRVRVRVRGREAGIREPAVPQASAAQGGLHGRAEPGVVRGIHGVQRDAQQRAPHQRPARVRGVKVGGIEVRHPVPQRQVGRRGVLSLQRDEAAHRRRGPVSPRVRLPAQQQLPGEAGPVELTRRDRHAHRIVAPGPVPPLLVAYGWARAHPEFIGRLDGDACRTDGGVGT
ncbi:hypothetical protein ASE15_07485 [Oerskovia sp. Root22]|nr:hypothetical protein ASE15_07485 [Oerskovia sp. Root22]